MIKKFNVIELKELYQFILKIWKLKYIKILDKNKFQFYVKI